MGGGGKGRVSRVSHELRITVTLIHSVSMLKQSCSYVDYPRVVHVVEITAYWMTSNDVLYWFYCSVR